MILVFDGSFNGLLTCVFEAYERKIWQPKVYVEYLFQPSLLDEHIVVETNDAKAHRILAGLERILGKALVRDFYTCFLSESADLYSIIVELMIRIFKGEHQLLENYGDVGVLAFYQMIKKVSRERHRMKAFIRFQKDASGLFTAVIEPDFNVLPLIITFFRKRYADQKWLIYDMKRKYGALYDKLQVVEVRLSELEQISNTALAASIDLDEQDALYQQLWKRYYKSTNIEARRNMKLHLQYVPRRYWKYLVEKQ